VLIAIIFLLLVELGWFGTIIGEMTILATIVALLFDTILISPNTKFVLLGIIVVHFLVQP